MWTNEHPRLEITSSKSFYDMFAKDARGTFVWNGLIPSTDRMKVWGKSRTSSRAACARARMESAARALQVWVGLRGGAWAIYDPPLLPLHYTCDEIHILFNCPNLLRFRCVSFCCTRYKMSKWRDQVWLTWILVLFVMYIVFHPYPLVFSTIWIFSLPLGVPFSFLFFFFYLILILLLLVFYICIILTLIWCRTGGGHVQWRRLVCYVQPYLDTPRKLVMLNMQIKP